MKCSEALQNIFEVQGFELFIVTVFNVKVFIHIFSQEQPYLTRIFFKLGNSGSFWLQRVLSKNTLVDPGIEKNLKIQELNINSNHGPFIETLNDF